ncbi:MAG TPA: hypothetical protein VHD90_02395 [Phototrophicaceae bacterium]|nr:hypothetical protein [Phototrophicaceae bacterium]
MKRFALFTVLAALFFGTLAAASAHAPYYVAWDASARYICSHSNGQYEMNVAHAYLDYDAANAVIATETDYADDPTGHHVYPQVNQTDWTGTLGQRRHWDFTFISTGYPITMQAVLKTYDNGKEVYLSTLTARCTADTAITSSLPASTHNVENPLVFGVYSEQGAITYRP